MPDEGLPQRTLKTSFWLGLFVMLVLGVRFKAGVALGFGIGAGLGLFSLASLAYVIPRLMTPDNLAAKPMLILIALFKLPVYAVVLWFAMSSKSINPYAVAAGVALVPLVLVLKVLGYQMVQKLNDSEGEKSCPSKISPSA